MLRGVSMNRYMGNPDNAGIHGYTKSTAINKPSNFFVTMDENEVTVNDAYFRVDVDANLNLNASSMKINDWPAAYHGGSGGISFADGHAEVHKWRFLANPPDGFSPSSGTTLTGPAVKDLVYLSRISSQPIAAVPGWD